MITSLLFFPSNNIWRTPVDLGLAYEDISVTTKDGVNLHGWYLPAHKPKYTLLFLHGNAGNVCDRLEKAKGWIDRNVSVLLIDYRGFGKSEGKIQSETDLYLDGQAGYQWLINKGIKPENILIYGESIGSSPALDLANSEPVKGVILEGAFSSLQDMAKKHYFPVPDFLVGNFKFDNRGKIKTLKVPVFFIHGSGDEICPIEMSRELYDTAAARKEYLTLQGAGHNDTYSGEFKEMFEKPLAFFE